MQSSCILILLTTTFITALNTTVQKKSGDSLVLDLDITEEVEMIHNSTDAAGPSSGQICTVDGRSLQCKPEYTQRASLTAGVELRAVTPSDSGVYTVMDKKNEEVIRIYTVIIEDIQPCRDQGAAVPVWLFVLSLTVCGVLLLVIGWMWRKNQQLQKRCEGNGINNRNREEKMSLSAMQSSCILILLTTTFITVSESANPSVKVKFNEMATLPCSERCSGLVRWTVFTKPTDILAECDQTSCRSVKEGYQMIHDEYLKGDFSLIITDADFTKRARYTCDCDDRDLCDVKLQIEPLNTMVQKKSGDSLVLDLDITEEVEVIHNSTGAAGPSSGQICTVDGRSLQCKPEYTQRASLTAGVELRGVTPSDSGVYTVMDKKNEEVIRIYTVIIEDGVDDSEAQRQIDKPRFRRSAASDIQPCRDQGAAVPVWLFVLSLTVCGVLLLVIGWMWRKNQQLQKRCEGNGISNHNREEMMSL